MEKEEGSGGEGKEDGVKWEEEGVRISSVVLHMRKQLLQRELRFRLRYCYSFSVIVHN